MRESCMLYLPPPTTATLRLSGLNPSVLQSAWNDSDENEIIIINNFNSKTFFIIILVSNLQKELLEWKKKEGKVCVFYKNRFGLATLK